MSAAVFARTPDVAWRIGTDRVLVHRIWPVDGLADAADLLGLAAMIWAVLDEPGDVDDVTARLAENPGGATIDGERARSALDDLRSAGWITTG